MKLLLAFPPMATNMRSIDLYLGFLNQLSYNKQHHLSMIITPRISIKRLSGRRVHHLLKLSVTSLFIFSRYISFLYFVRHILTPFSTFRVANLASGLFLIAHFLARLRVDACFL